MFTLFWRLNLTLESSWSFFETLWSIPTQTWASEKSLYFNFDSLATAQRATYLPNGVKSQAGMLLLTRPLEKKMK